MTSRPETVRHIVIDMQRIFAEKTEWHTPAVMEILPNVLKLCQAFDGRTLFAKFMVPERPEEAQGRWQAYYERWSMLTTHRLDPSFQDLVAPLFEIAPAHAVVEKPTYSIFQVPGFADRLRSEGIERLVFSGVETDVCVLASVFGAVDEGFHAVVISDAVGSSVPSAHEVTLEHVLTRMSDQIEIMTTDEAIALEA